MFKNSYNYARKQASKVAKVGTGLLVASSSHAAIDVTAITALLGDAATAVGTVGVALLLIWGTKKAYSSITGR